MFYSVISIFMKCLILSSSRNTVDNCHGNNHMWRKNRSLLWIPSFSIVVQNDWYTVVKHEWFIGIITDCMQFIYRILLVWFVFIKNDLLNEYELNVRRLHTMEMDWYTMDDRKEGRTLDFNPFNNVYSIYMLSVIMIMRIEWKESKWMRMWLVVIRIRFL